MRDIALAVKILSYKKEHNVSEDEAFISLGLDKQISKKKWDRLKGDFWAYFGQYYDTPLSRKLALLYFLSKNNKQYYNYDTFMNRVHFYITPRTFYSYIANIKQEGFTILTKYGYYNGYKLVDQLNF